VEWTDRWTIKSYVEKGTTTEVRQTTLTEIFKFLDEEETIKNKPANETGTVLSTIMALKAGFRLQKVEAYFDGNLQLGA